MKRKKLNGNFLEKYLELFLKLKVVLAADTFYCIDADKLFPVEDGGLLYTNDGDFKNQSNPKVTALNISSDNYKALKWLVDNIYLPRDNGASTYKDVFLRKAFANDIHSQDELNALKSLLTDDDIEVVQQWAMWHFTNPDNVNYQTMRAISLKRFDVSTMSEVDVDGSFFSTRQIFCNKLFFSFLF